MPSKSDLKSANAEKYVQEIEKQEELDIRLHGEVQKVSTIRRALPQVLASTAKNLILLDLGMTIAFPTFVIPALLNAKEGLSFTTSQASWFGSISFICQPLGSILSGILLEPLGRKYSMLIVNIPHIIGWLMLYSASSIFTMYAAAVIMGLGVGFMEAPIITYVGEISEPTLRGILTSYAGLFVSLGFVVTFTLGSLAHWQQAALISCLVPIVTVVAISQVPETPFWLLSRGRIEEAEKALCWLRGWAEPRAIRKELAEMIRYSEASKLKNTQPTFEKAVYSNTINLDDEKEETKIKNFENNVAISGNSKHIKVNEEINEEDPGYKDNSTNMDRSAHFVNVDLNNGHQSETEKSNSKNNNTVHLEKQLTDSENGWKIILKDMVRPEMMKPLSVVILFFFFLSFSGITAMRPYLVLILKALNIPIDPYKTTGILFGVGFSATVLCMLCVKRLGKRAIALPSFLGCGISLIGLMVYSYVGNGTSSPSWVPFGFLVILQFCNGFGVSPVPWMLVSEVFPFRGRSLASGIAAAFSYILSFVAAKTCLSLITALTLPGTFLLYGTINIIGLITLYRYMPETEGRSLEEIEEGYKSSKK